MGKWIYKRDWKKKPGDPGLWPEKKKTEAVLTWMTTGNLTQTAAVIGVGLPTLKKWRKQPWWQEIVEGFHDDDKIELDTKYQKIIRKALAVVDDRLENGNFQLDQKTGEVIRIPVSMSDTHRVMKDLVDQQQLLRQDKTVAIEAKETVNDKLAKLALQFAEMAMSKTKKQSSGEIYDMELERMELEDQTSLEPLQAVETIEVIPNPTPTS